MARSRPPDPEPITWTCEWVKVPVTPWGERYHGIKRHPGRPDQVCSHLHTHPSLALACARTDFGRRKLPTPGRNTRAVRRAPSTGQTDLLEELADLDNVPPF